MWRWFLKTDAGVAGFLLRLVLAAAIFPHGVQKLVGVFGGRGFTETMEYFTETLEISWILAFLVIIVEFFAPIALLFGLFTRLAALAIGVIMVAGAWMAHFEYGFFMNWYDNQGGEGVEYHILAVGIALALVWTGAGRFSFDSVLSHGGRSARN